MPLLKDISGLLITKGLKLLSKGLYLGRGLIEAIPGPPNPSDIIRWFTKQEDNILIDSISSNDGDKILPVSVFDGFDGAVVLSNPTTPTNTVSFMAYVADAKIIAGNTLFNSNNSVINGLQFRYDNGRLEILKGNVESIYTHVVSLNNGDCVEFDYDLSSGDSNMYVNGLVAESNVGGRVDFSFSDIVFGAKTNTGSEAYDGALFNVLYKVDNYELFIPLPHLPYGFDSSNNPIPLTVSGGVSLGYDINGSSYLQDKGVVERNPELVSSLSDFTEGDTGAIISIIDDELKIENGDESAAYTAALPAAINIGSEYEIVGYVDTSNSTSPARVAVGGYDSGSTLSDTVSIVFTATLAKGVNLTNGSSAVIGDYSVWKSLSIKLTTPEIIPNTPIGQAAYPIVSGDTFIAGGGMMNSTDCLVRLYEVGDTDPAKLFFNKSDRLIWKTGTGGDWHTSELEQQAIYDNIQDAYKYQFWSKINSTGIFRDLFLYSAPLIGSDICPAKKYVKLGETYTDLTGEEATLLCNIDIFKE